MMVLKLGPNGVWKDCLDIAVQVIKHGGTVVYPTDTCYGLGADSANPKAIARVYSIKGRLEKHALSVMVSSKKEIGVVAEISAAGKRLVSKFLPGPLTLVLKKRIRLPKSLTAGKPTVAVRFSAGGLAADLAGKLGRPITATSANLSGAANIYSAAQVIEIFGRRRLKPDLVIDAGVLPNVNPSTIVDLSSKPYKILRKGPVSFVQIKKCLGKKVELIDYAKN